MTLFWTDNNGTALTALLQRRGADPGTLLSYTGVVVGHVDQNGIPVLDPAAVNVVMANAEKPSNSSGDAPASLAKPGEAVLGADREKYILDGNGKGGGHGPGRVTPGKTTFPGDWSDEETIDIIKDVANDPKFVRTPVDGGGTMVSGTRNGVDVRVIIVRDGKAIVTAYPGP